MKFYLKVDPASYKTSVIGEPQGVRLACSSGAVDSWPGVLATWIVKEVVVVSFL